MAAPTVTTPSFEFTAEQNLILAKLASRMKTVGGALLMLAVLLALRAILGNESGSVLAMETGIMLFFIGLWSIRAGRALGRVVTTEGADVMHLMRALTDIWTLYELQYWVFLAIGLLLAVSLLVAITGGSWFPVAW